MDEKRKSDHEFRGEDNPISLEVYSTDNQLIGRVAGFLDESTDDTAAMQETPVDAVDDQGNPIGMRRMLIDGGGYIIQAQIAIPMRFVDVDWAGRRVTLNMTLAQIEQIPHGEAKRANTPDLSEDGSEEISGGA